MYHLTRRQEVKCSMVLFAVSAVCLLGCSKPSGRQVNTVRAGVVSTDQLLEETFRLLDEVDTLDVVAQRAKQTPGVRSVQYDSKNQEVGITFEPAISVEDVIEYGDWNDAFVVRNERDHSWFVVVYDGRSHYAGSYDTVSFAVPRHGRWRVIAIATGQPSGPTPRLGNGGPGAYPVADYPVRIGSIVVRSVRGR